MCDECECVWANLASSPQHFLKSHKPRKYLSCWFVENIILEGQIDIVTWQNPYFLHSPYKVYLSWTWHEMKLPLCSNYVCIDRVRCDTKGVFHWKYNTWVSHSEQSLSPSNRLYTTITSTRSTFIFITSHPQIFERKEIVVWYNHPSPCWGYVNFIWVLKFHIIRLYFKFVTGDVTVP